MDNKKIRTFIYISSLTAVCLLLLTVQACGKINFELFGKKSGEKTVIEPDNEKSPDNTVNNPIIIPQEDTDTEGAATDEKMPGMPSAITEDSDIKELRFYFTQAINYYEGQSYIVAEYYFNKIKDDYIIIQDHIFYYMAKSLLMQEKYYQSEEYYFKLTRNYPDSIWAEKASIEYADIFYIKEDYATAESEYKQFLTDFPDSAFIPYCLFQLASCQEINGKKKEAFKNYKEIWLKYPLSEYSEPSWDNLSRLADEDPLIEQFVPGANQIYSRGEIFFGAYQYHSAMNEYNKLLQEDYINALSLELHSRTLFKTGMCHYRLRDYAQARIYLIQSYEKAPSGSVADDSLYYAGMALTNLNMTDDAISYYQRLVNLFPSSNFSDDALYRTGRIYSLRGDFTNAAVYFKRVPSEYPSGDKLSDALWELGLIQYRAGDYSSAKKTFSGYASSYSGTSLEEKGLFWQAKSCHKLGENSSAMDLYRKITNLSSYSYYTFAAAEMLENMNSPVEINRVNNNLNPENPEVADIIPDVYSILEEESYDSIREDGTIGHVSKAIEFLKLGFPNSASLEIEAGTAEIEENPSKILEIATLYLKSGNYTNSINMIGKNLRKLKSELDGAYIDYLYYLYYPYGYREEVESYSDSYNIDPCFTLAVIRQESNFMPDVVSYAGARGLMQIMPGTGEGIARQIGISDYNVDMLTDPDINIKMGTFYLRQQLDNFSQNKIYCAGAYNGGPGRMSGWISDRGDMDTDEFIESIPYEQTREYVKKVMGNYYFYRMLYEE